MTIRYLAGHHSVNRIYRVFNCFVVVDFLSYIVQMRKCFCSTRSSFYFIRSFTHGIRNACSPITTAHSSDQNWIHPLAPGTRTRSFRSTIKVSSFVFLNDWNEFWSVESFSVQPTVLLFDLSILLQIFLTTQCKHVPSLFSLTYSKQLG